MHVENGINGTEFGAGISGLLAIVSVVKVPAIVSMCGEYLPVVQSLAGSVAILCGLIVIAKELRSTLRK